MQYSPKLKKAMMQIIEIIKANDIGCVVVLHEPGFSEYMFNIEPSYACVKQADNGELMLKANASDYPTKEDWVQAVANTANMFDTLGTTTSRVALMIGELNDAVVKAVTPIHVDRGTTTHTQQNS